MTKFELTITRPDGTTRGVQAKAADTVSLAVVMRALEQQLVVLLQKEMAHGAQN